MTICHNRSDRNGSFTESLLQCSPRGAQPSTEGWHTHFPVGEREAGGASRRRTHSASRRRRSTASPSASGSAWGPSPRCGRLPAARFLRGATALQGSGAATTAAMPLTSPARQSSRHAADVTGRVTRYVIAKPPKAGGGSARDRWATGRRYWVLSRGPYGAGAPGGREGVRPGRSGCRVPAPDHRRTSLGPCAHPDWPPAVPSGCQGLFRSHKTITTSSGPLRTSC